MNDDFDKSGPIDLADIVEGPAPVSRAERRDQQVQRILEAAKTCFVRSGFQGASMQQIRAEAGMSPGALYRYFASKEAIVEAICEADRKQDAELFKLILQTPDVVEGVVMGAMAHIRHIHEEKMAPLFAEIMAESMRNGSIDCVCRENMEQVMQMLGAYLGRAAQRGEIEPVAPIESLLPTMMSMCHGLALNDLPSEGVPLEQVEIILRASVVGILRPTGRKHSQ